MGRSKTSIAPGQADGFNTWDPEVGRDGPADPPGPPCITCSTVFTIINFINTLLKFVSALSTTVYACYMCVIIIIRASPDPEEAVFAVNLYTRIYFGLIAGTRVAAFGFSMVVIWSNVTRNMQESLSGRVGFLMLSLCSLACYGGVAGQWFQRKSTETSVHFGLTVTGLVAFSLAAPIFMPAVKDWMNQKWPCLIAPFVYVFGGITLVFLFAMAIPVRVALLGVAAIGAAQEKEQTGRQSIDDMAESLIGAGMMSTAYSFTILTIGTILANAVLAVVILVPTYQELHSMSLIQEQGGIFDQLVLLTDQAPPTLFARLDLLMQIISITLMIIKPIVHAVFTCQLRKLIKLMRWSLHLSYVKHVLIPAIRDALHRIGDGSATHRQLEQKLDEAENELQRYIDAIDREIANKRSLLY